MAEKINLTMAVIDRLKPLPSGRRWTYDAKVSGLVVQTTETGAKAFYLYRRISGKPERHRLGSFPEMTVDAARDHANKLLARIADGDNPVEAKRKQRGELTVGTLFDLFLEFRAIPHKKPRSIAEDKSLFNRYLTPWKDRKLSSVTSNDVRSLHAKIGKTNGKIAANRMLALLSTMFTVATDHGEWKQLNPCRGVKQFAEKSRDRFLQPDEVPRFLEALTTLPNQNIADAFRLMLWTGARKSNLLAMRWDELDLASSTWRIPDTKAGEPQRVHLTAEAVAILSKLKAAAKDGAEWVFPARTAGTAVGHVQDVVKPWKAVCEAADLPELRMHDLRRSLGSWMAAGGSSLQIIGKTLGHSNQNTTAIYSRLNIETVRAAVDSAVAAMLATNKQPEQPADDDNVPLGVG